MPNLDLDIVQIMHGDTPVDKIFKGDTQIWPALPYDAVVEYIQTDGDAYIDTGIKVAGILHVKTYLVDYFTSSFANGTWPFGGRTSSTSNTYGLFIASSTSKVNHAYYNATAVHELYSYYPQSCWVEMQQGSLKIDNTTYTFTKRTFTGTYNLYLFGLNNAGTLVKIPGLKMGATLVTNGTNTLDMIPVRVGQVGYFYDRISGQLVGNSNSTGAFTPGPDVT